MTSSLSGLSNNIAEGIFKIKCKYEHGDKKCETSKIKCKDGDYFLEYTNFKNNLIEYIYLYCYKNNEKKLDEKLKW